MHLEIHTAATGIPNAQFSYSDPRQPYLLSFTGIIWNDGVEVDRLSTLVKPGSKASLSQAAFDLHGISLSQALENGMDARRVFHWFQATAKCASFLLSRRMDHDVGIMAILGARLTGTAWTPPCSTVCIGGPSIQFDGRRISARDRNMSQGHAGSVPEYLLHHDNYSS